MKRAPTTEPWIPSLERVYWALRRLGSSTRPELAERTGLSVPAVSTAVHELEARGLIGHGGKREVTAGRKPRLVRLLPEAHPVLAIDLGGARLHAALFDLHGKLLTTHDGPSVGAFSRFSPEERTNTLEQLVRAFPQAQALALSVPGIIRVDGTVRQSWPFGFQDINLKSQLQTRLRLPITLENDANAAAWGEHQRGCARNSQTFVWVTFDPGIGAGVVVNGQIHRGAQGMAGELALIAPSSEALERGGLRFGALAYTIFDELREGSSRTSFDLTRADWMRDVFEAAHNGEARALAALERVSRYLVVALSGALATLDPDLVVLRAELPHLEPLIAVPARTHLKRLGFQTKLEISSLGDNAGALGVGLMAAQALERSLLMG